MAVVAGLSDADQALCQLLLALRGQAYHFVTPTPLTHQRVWDNRQQAPAQSLRDAFGWNLPFDAGLLAPPLWDLAQQAGVLVAEGERFRSAVRVASLDDQLFVHSSFPTDAVDTVFFGPDTHRFAALLRDSLPPAGQRTGLRLLDVGCGSGAGGLFVARRCPDSERVLNDINPLALRYAAVNAQAARLPVTLALGDALAAVSGDFDLILSNPPYLADDAQRAYRHGGDGLGRALSVRIAGEALGRLRPGGRLVLYTGVAMVDGVDPLLNELRPLLAASRCDWHYRELDPDVFGEELARPAYRHCERIAAVGLVAVVP